MQPRYLLSTAGAIGALSLVAWAAHARMAVTTEDFVRTASIANQFEIKSSELALEKSQRGDVKSFAKQMVDDHTQTGVKLKQALQSSATSQQAEDTLDDKHQKLFDTLESASSDTFDTQYIGMQVDAHKEAVSLFSSYAKSGRDAVLKDFASQTLPTLKSHLSHVTQLQHAS
jgi:putative membrane protein